MRKFLFFGVLVVVLAFTFTAFGHEKSPPEFLGGPTKYWYSDGRMKIVQPVLVGLQYEKYDMKGKEAYVRIRYENIYDESIVRWTSAYGSSSRYYGGSITWGRVYDVEFWIEDAWKHKGEISLSLCVLRRSGESNSERRCNNPSDNRESLFDTNPEYCEFVDCTKEDIDKMRWPIDDAWKIKRQLREKLNRPELNLLDYSWSGKWSDGTFKQSYKLELITKGIWSKERHFDLEVFYYEYNKKNPLGTIQLILPGMKREATITFDVPQRALSEHREFRSERRQNEPIWTEELHVKVYETLNHAQTAEYFKNVKWLVDGFDLNASGLQPKIEFK